jgi:hypothetical protein
MKIAVPPEQLNAVHAVKRKIAATSGVKSLSLVVVITVVAVQYAARIHSACHLPTDKRVLFADEAGFTTKTASWQRLSSKAGPWSCRDCTCLQPLLSSAVTTPQPQRTTDAANSPTQ